MDADEIKEEIEHQRILQKEYRKRLRVLEQQAAKYGDAYVPPHIQIEIDDSNDKIDECESLILSMTNQIFRKEELQQLINDTRQQLARKEADYKEVTEKDHEPNPKRIKIILWIAHQFLLLYVIKNLKEKIEQPEQEYNQI
jgi:hypothetical protein